MTKTINIIDPDKNKNSQIKYRATSTRLREYDYGQNGAYFITICTKNREPFFGEILNDKMQLSDVGEIAQKFWEEIPDHFPFVILGEWVIMPNHTHGVIFIDRTSSVSVETPNLGVSMPYWKPGNLGVIINQYKRACIIQSRKINAGFAWQSRFYDRIIRNETELNHISEYIILNPQNWETDDYFY